MGELPLMTIGTFNNRRDGEGVVGAALSCPGIAVSTFRKGHPYSSWTNCRLEQTLKGAKSWIRFPDGTLTGGLIQVDPAAGTQATAVGPAERLKRQIQQHILPQEPGQINAIIRQNIHVDLCIGQLDFLGRKGLR